MSGSPYSPLAHLVLVIVCLSVAGTCIAGVYYYAVDLPQQNNLQEPTNDLMSCSLSCDAQYYSCIPSCKGSGSISATQTCRSNCLTEYTACKDSC